MDEGDLFRNIRRALDMDQERFGALFDKGQSWVTKLERGKIEGAKQFLDILRTLVVDHNLNPYYLINGEAPIFLVGTDRPALQPSQLSIEERLARLEVLAGVVSNPPKAE